MINKSEQIRKQRQTGYLLFAIAGAVVLLLAALVLFYDYPPVFVLGALLPGAILVFWGYRNVTAARNDTVVIDERTSEIYDKAGHSAFWILMTVIIVDRAVAFIPSEGTGLIYSLAGVASFAVFYAYYRWL